LLPGAHGYKNQNLSEIIKMPGQYQGYAPDGMWKYDKKLKKQVKITSPYQLLMQHINEGKMSPAEIQRLETIRNMVIKMSQDPNFGDTTGGRQYYSHASDGSIYLGKTIKNATNAVNKHEKVHNLPKTDFGSVNFMPVITRR
jgi:hypothetical protein